MIKRFFILYIVVLGFPFAEEGVQNFWQSGLYITPFRLPLPSSGEDVKYIDLDNDGDPDVLRTRVRGTIPVQWIDDDDDMKKGDLAGDMDSDCLMIDRNRDGFYGGEHDLILDWNDEDGDGKADLQVLVDYSGFDDRGLWQSHYMWFIDTDKDRVFNYIDWNTLMMEGWEHSGRARFFPDYHGKSIFLKVHANTFNINDLRYNWENPFLFYDPDNDGQTEITIRYIDDPVVRDELPPVNQAQKNGEIEPSVIFSGKISSIQMGIDLDNDSEPGNELDFDMSLKFSGEGFDYSDQVHTYKSLRGLPEADVYFFDPRWRRLTELVYADHEAGYKLLFERARWDECWFVFDEDDDCHRWERVEFYSPLDIFKVGSKKGGLDDNPQADVTGDRGEWDMDFSGGGKLYIGKFDGRLHLYGAEWGAWRIDQNARYYQGWQGWRGENLQPEDLIDKEPESFATIKYSDTDNNGFIDLIEYDLDGDRKMETEVSLLRLGIDDTSALIDISGYSYAEFNALYRKMASQLWKKAGRFRALAESHGLNCDWYAPLFSARSDREKYHNGYWLSFYLYRDLKHLARIKRDLSLSRKLDLEYYAGLDIN